MHIQIPKSVDIGGKTWKIVVKTRLVDEDGCKLLGQFRPNDSTILLEKQDNHEEMLSTLMHEIIHAALYMSGWNEMLIGQQEEALTRALENMLFQPLKDLFKGGSTSQTLQRKKFNPPTSDV